MMKSLDQDVFLAAYDASLLYSHLPPISENQLACLWIGHYPQAQPFCVCYPRRALFGPEPSAIKEVLLANFILVITSF